MNTYTIDTIQQGDTERFTVTVAPEWFEQFRALSGDDNPLHTDEQYAVGCGFQDRVLYGMCTASLYSRLAGVYLPGKYCLLEEVQTKFVKPVYEGDMLTVTGTVKEVDTRFNRIEIRAEIRNQSGERVSRAKIFCGFLEEAS